MIETETQTPSQVRNVYERMTFQDQIENIQSDLITPIQNIEQTIVENTGNENINKNIVEITKEQSNFKNNTYKKINELKKKVDGIDTKMDKILKLLEDK